MAKYKYNIGDYVFVDEKAIIPKHDCGKRTIKKVPQYKSGWICGIVRKHTGSWETEYEYDEYSYHSYGYSYFNIDKVHMLYLVRKSMFSKPYMAYEEDIYKWGEQKFCSDGNVWLGKQIIIDNEVIENFKYYTDDNIKHHKYPAHIDNKIYEPCSHKTYRIYEMKEPYDTGYICGAAYKKEGNLYQFTDKFQEQLNDGFVQTNKVKTIIHATNSIKVYEVRCKLNGHIIYVDANFNIRYPFIKKCMCCGKFYDSRESTAKFYKELCSKTCEKDINNNFNQEYFKECAYCNKEYLTYSSTASYKDKYCSMKCEDTFHEEFYK